MEQRIRLKVLGLSYSQIQQGAYALILAQVNGPYRIPVVIGPAEAQSIAMTMESIKPPRPMTHDLFVSFAHTFGVKLKEAFIYKFEDGIFSCELTFTDGERTVVIDSRTSDGIAIAMRTGSPIYTTQAILDQTGFLLEVEGENHEGSEEDDDDDDDDTGFDSYDDDDTDDEILPDEEEEESSYTREPRLENYAIEELERTIARLTEREEYEEAARVMAILKRKREQRDGDGDAPQSTDQP
ncbi:MAG: bifunctional nuclease family protein [Duncaniella sp.]|nr:bifunctional nuclease family protein [Duncaniella sp.]